MRNMGDLSENRIVIREVYSRIDYLFYGRYESHGFSRLRDEMEFDMVLHDLGIFMDKLLTVHIGRGIIF